MAVLEILKYPHPVLKKTCKSVEQVDEEVKRLIHDMNETMYDANGIGLAACQVGIPRAGHCHGCEPDRSGPGILCH